jgi:hypothetical protein
MRTVWLVFNNDGQYSVVAKVCRSEETADQWIAVELDADESQTFRSEEWEVWE